MTLQTEKERSEESSSGLPRMHGALGSVLAPNKPDMVGHTCKWRRVDHKFKAIFSYTVCLTMAWVK